MRVARRLCCSGACAALAFQTASHAEAPMRQGAALGGTGRGPCGLVPGVCGARRGLEVPVGTLRRACGCLTARRCTWTKVMPSVNGHGKKSKIDETYKTTKSPSVACPPPWLGRCVADPWTVQV